MKLQVKTSFTLYFLKAQFTFVYNLFQQLFSLNTYIIHLQG